MDTPSQHLDQEYLTVSETAKCLKTSEFTVRRYIKKGLLDASKLGPGMSAHFRISTSSIEKLLHSKGGL